MLCGHDTTKPLVLQVNKSALRWVQRGLEEPFCSDPSPLLRSLYSFPKFKFLLFPCQWVSVRAHPSPSTHPDPAACELSSPFLICVLCVVTLKWVHTFPHRPDPCLVSSSMSYRGCLRMKHPLHHSTHRLQPSPLCLSPLSRTWGRIAPG